MSATPRPHDLLRELGGTLAVESEPGVFTQFFVHLPWDSKRKPA